jgi:hypothetical protein
MKKFSTAILIAMAVISLSSCDKVVGKGPVVTETRNTGEFTRIESNVPGNIRYIESNDFEILIEAQRNIIDVIETHVSGNELKIKVRSNTNIKSHEDVNITVSAPSVNTIALRGSGNIEIPGTFDPEHAKLSVSGSGNIRVENLRSDDLELTISGSGNADIYNGTTGHETISISGSGDVNVLGVEAMAAVTQTSGSGTIRLWVTDDLDARISGSGSVFYKGSPSVNASISGSGRVAKL